MEVLPNAMGWQHPGLVRSDADDESMRPATPDPADESSHRYRASSVGVEAHAARDRTSRHAHALSDALDSVIVYSRSPRADDSLTLDVARYLLASARECERAYGLDERTTRALESRFNDIAMPMHARSLLASDIEADEPMDADASAPAEPFDHGIHEHSPLRELTIALGHLAFSSSCSDARSRASAQWKQHARALIFDAPLPTAFASMKL